MRFFVLPFVLVCFGSSAWAHHLVCMGVLMERTNTILATEAQLDALIADPTTSLGEQACAHYMQANGLEKALDALVRGWQADESVAREIAVAMFTGLALDLRLDAEQKQSLWARAIDNHAHSQFYVGFGLMGQTSKVEPSSISQALIDGARFWLTLSADADHPYAQEVLGRIYLHGWYAPTDFDRAFALNTAAFTGGNQRAAINLGIHYMDGKGVAVDLERATMFLEIALNEGIPQAADLLNQVNQGRVGGTGSNQAQ